METPGSGLCLGFCIKVLAGGGNRFASVRQDFGGRGLPFRRSHSAVQSCWLLKLGGILALSNSGTICSRSLEGVVCNEISCYR